MKKIIYQNREITPSKIVCIGRNYVEHIKELNNEMPENMVVFNKPNSAITDTLKFFSEDTRFEGEICFLMMDGKIDGVGFGLDLTKADIQNYLKSKGLPWERAKGFDGSAVLSEFVKFHEDLQTLRFELYLNGKLQQEADYSLMIYKPAQMIEEIESFMKIEDGDIIMSGTPKGVATYKVEDAFEARVFSGETLLLEVNFLAV